MALVISVNLEIWKDFNLCVDVVETEFARKLFKALSETTKDNETEFSDFQHRTAVGRLLMSLVLFSW